ncbi:amidohydrolase [Halogeometricum limi]|uniref:Aminobenzoyl-glutamate utilization protein A n=1 Tax=Halogeometricum limi TaxID=555875 RepID=A0A1I6IE34_9EURY|nr:amidohydrolase [Halogeometricum limi]SFR64992.1 aminobenzoyl-glutamate utilization protein A [Halogeometricum limi]
MATEGTPPVSERLSEIRRRLHRYPEPAWCEFATTSAVVDEAERIGVDELHYGRELYESERRLSLPPEEELEAWHERARERGARTDVLERTRGGYTGAVAVLERGSGPTVALRVDMDALFVAESDAESHRPTREGFRSVTDGVMHACGHDGHTAIGLGVLEAVRDSDFEGTFKVVFQPAEEVAGGARALAQSGHVDGVDHLVAVHLGLDRPTGTVVAGMTKMLAKRRFFVEFSGTSAHAAKNPEQGANAVQAAVDAASSVYAIPRHGGGATRVNVGRIEGGTTTNVVSESAEFELEVRGDDTDLMEYMYEECETVIRTAAERYGCDADVTVRGEAIRADSDERTSRHVLAAAEEHPSVTDAVASEAFGASEDATYLMKRVTERGGTATYAVVGTDHPAGHHAAAFDVDEASLGLGVEVLADAVVRAGRE